jgi:hypothetical protein
LDSTGEAGKVGRGRARSSVRREQVQAQQGGVKGVRVFPSGERGPCPFEGRATLEEFFAGSGGRGRDAGVGEEL